ncbi:MAG: hypothetical protein ABJB32_07215 [Verrucomicrobiota bacterium]
MSLLLSQGTVDDTMAELRDDKVVAGMLDAESLGIPRAPTGDLRGGDPAANTRVLEGILAGNIRGRKRDWPS